jgi:uncharacterized protein YebE (UPF0316 family)
MFPKEFTDSDTFVYVLLPLMIFVARIMDVSIGTLRIIFVSRGNKVVAPILGFFEVLIWVFAISNILQHLNNVYAYIGYAAGFATGNLVGMLIEERIALGILLVRVITRREASNLITVLNEKGFGTTVIEAKGRNNNDVHVLYTVVKRKDISETIDLIQQHNPKAFYTIEDIKYVSNENYTHLSKDRRLSRFYLFGGWRKGK